MKMKKFINAPETITDEELTGLGLAYPDILEVDGHLVISKDLADADRVTIVTYGEMCIRDSPYCVYSFWHRFLSKPVRLAKSSLV